MRINTPIFHQQIAHQYESLIDHGDEGIGALAPGVAVGDFFEDVRFLGEGVAANFDVHGEVSAHVEGRINVDEF